MATKPVKVLSDLLTKKQIIKQDSNNNVLFNVSGTLENGHVSSSLPITASYFVGDGRYLTNISASGGISSVYTSGSVTGSGLLSNPITLTDPLIINTITSSYIYSPQITGTLYGTASYAVNVTNTANIQNAYKRLRYQKTGSFDISGGAIIELPTTLYGGASFQVASLNFINVNVFIKEDERWINDLISIQLYTSSTNIYVELSAPALANADQYKLIAVNEDPDYYVV
jgi:hypothetical protein